MRFQYVFVFLLIARAGYCFDCPAGISQSQAALQLQEIVAEAQQDFQRGNYSGAADRFRQALCFAPQNGSIYYGLGLAEAAANHFDLARAALDHAIRLSPGATNILLALAQVNASAGNIEEAIRVLAEREHLGAAPSSEQQDVMQLRAQLAQALLSQSRSELALAQLLRLRRMGVHDPATMLTLATLENNLGAWGDAIKDCTTAIDDPTTTPVQRSTAATVAGLAFKNQSKYDDAARMFDAAIQQQPSEIACLALAEVYDRIEKMGQAVNVLKSCGAKLPESTAVATALGRNLVNAGNYEEGRAVLTRVTQNTSGQPEAWRWLAQAQTSLGEYQKAIESLETIARIQPGYLMIDTMIAQAILKTGHPDYQQALKYLDRAAQTSPADPNVFYLRGKVYLSASRYNEAIEAFQKALQLGPDSSLTYYQFGRALAAAGRQVEARQQFERVQLLKSIGK
jgi:tetratricopeptide (TPR) repeat protein